MFNIDQTRTLPTRPDSQPSAGLSQSWRTILFVLLIVISFLVGYMNSHRRRQATPEQAPASGASLEYRLGYFGGAAYVQEKNCEALLLTLQQTDPGATQRLMRSGHAQFIDGVMRRKYRNEVLADPQLGPLVERQLQETSGY